VCTHDLSCSSFAPILSNIAPSLVIKKKNILHLLFHLIHIKWLTHKLTQNSLEGIRFNVITALCNYCCRPFDLDQWLKWLDYVIIDVLYESSDLKLKAVIKNKIKLRVSWTTVDPNALLNSRAKQYHVHKILIFFFKYQKKKCITML
jgi:hypothetical protein